MITIIAAAIVLTTLVFVHELGHFAAARWAGVRVHAFSIGLGPVLLRRRLGHTEYRLSAIPFGGYVRLAGLRLFDDRPEDTPGAEFFTSKSRGARIGVYLAGPAASLLLGFALVAAGHAAGSELLSTSDTSRITFVEPRSAAWTAGLRPGDDVMGTDTMSFLNIEALYQVFASDPGGAIGILVRRGDADILVPVKIPDNGDVGTFGLVFNPSWMPADAPFGGGLIGPIGIGWMMGRVWQTVGWWALVEAVGLISVGLGLLNLMPIPPLDGGHITMLMIEALRRRDFSRRIRMGASVIGLTAVLALTATSTYFDVVRLLR